jgi:acyl-CoA oxidase
MVATSFTRLVPMMQSKFSPFDDADMSDTSFRFMSPTAPMLGRPCVAIVFAQLIAADQRCGIRPFLVTINDGHHMSSGITAK